MISSRPDMRLRMAMKSPESHGAAGVKSFLSKCPLADAKSLPLSHRGLVGYIWQRYADSLISDADTCMECCGSAEEILYELTAISGSPEISRAGHSRWRIGNSRQEPDGCIFLSEEDDGGIYLLLGSSGDRLDISDFGPVPAAELILNLLGAYSVMDLFYSR